MCAPTNALLPLGPDVGPIRDWFRSMFSAFRITFARLAACGPIFGFGILSLRSGRRLGQKWGQFTLFHKFSGDAAEATARSTPLQTPLRVGSKVRPRPANGTDRTRTLRSSTAGICGGTSARGRARPSKENADIEGQVGRTLAMAVHRGERRGSEVEGRHGQEEIR